MDLWAWLVHVGLIRGDANAYSSGKFSDGKPLTVADYQHAIRTAITNLQYASDPTAKAEFYRRLQEAGGLVATDNLDFYISGQAQQIDIENLINKASERLFGSAGTGGPPTPESGAGGGSTDPITDVPPVEIGSSTIPAGGRLVRVDNPQGSDEPHLYYIIYEWRGVEFAYEVGGPARFKELFGSTDNFDGFTKISQSAFDESNFVQVGLIDQELGATESLGSRIERDIRALGMEDLPGWLSNSPDALALVGQATAQEWSSGRLWTELSGTGAFQQRFGAVWAKYKTDNVTIADAVAQIVADENALSAALRPWATEGVSTETIHAYLNNGWTASAASQVLEAAEDLSRRPDTLDFVNQVLLSSGFAPLDEVSYINAIHGHGPQEAIEAVNTAQAARALIESGIDLADEDVDLIMDLVDTSDRLLTPESWRSLAQELSFNIMRNTRELGAGKLGLAEDDLIAAAFGRESPSGKSTGEVLGLLARFERDRRGEAEGHDAMSGFVDDRGRLRVPGLAGL